MSLFVRIVRRQSPKIRAVWGFSFSPPVAFANAPSNGIDSGAITSNPSLTSLGTKLVENVQSLLSGISTWLIKRTYQPSIIRKRRKHGFMRRKESAGGRNVLKRRLAKGRKRLGGS
ncbi:hypothetical protein ACHAXT_000617 [Thalassiosira profunda]